MEKGKHFKLKCTNCNTTKDILSSFIVKNTHDNTYLEVKDFLPALKIFSNHDKENPKLYNKVLDAFFHSNIYLCSQKCKKIYMVKQ